MRNRGLVLLGCASCSCDLTRLPGQGWHIYDNPIEGKLAHDNLEVCLSVCERERARARVRGRMSCVEIACFKDHSSWAATAAGNYSSVRSVYLVTTLGVAVYSGSAGMNLNYLVETDANSLLSGRAFDFKMLGKHHLSFAFSLPTPIPTLSCTHASVRHKLTLSHVYYR